MRNYQGYDRTPLNTRTVATDAVAIGESNMRKAWERGLIAKPIIVVSFDVGNNVGRHCSLPGDPLSRQWEVTTPMRDQWFNRYYLVTHLISKRTRIVASCDMHSLY